MKAILISIKPKYVALELNGDKTIEVRNTAPKDWKDYLNGKAKEMPKPIDVYIYCTKEEEMFYKYYGNTNKREYFVLKNRKQNRLSNGVVVAKFTLNKVEEINHKTTTIFGGVEDIVYSNEVELLKKSRLQYYELKQYLGTKIGYAWHISNLEIFDKPKELSEFYITHITIDVGKKIRTPLMYPRRLTKAPQSWCYVEVE